MVLHVPLAASKLELEASKRNRAFFLGHPVSTEEENLHESGEIANEKQDKESFPLAEIKQGT